MTRLVWTELRRWFSRSLLWGLAGGTVLLMLLVPFQSWSGSRAPSQEDLRDAQLQVEQFEPMSDADIEVCRAEEAREREATGDPTVDFDCDWRPTATDFLPWRQYFDTEAQRGVAGVSILLAVVALMAGASFVAAEFTTGAIGNWLTFAPRRGRVLTSKLVAAGLGFLPTAVVAVTTLLAGTWGAFALNDALHNPRPQEDAPLWDVADAVGFGARLVAAIVLLAVAGAALGFVARHTAAVLGLVVAWAVVVEGMLGSVVPRLQGLQLHVNLEAWLQRGTEYTVEVCAPNPEGGGQVCAYVPHAVSQLHGAVVLLVVVAVLVSVAALVFRRRDVG